MTRAFSDQYTAEAVCTRDTLTQAVALSLNRDAVEALLVSVPGKLKLKLKSGFKKVKKKISILLLCLISCGVVH